MYLFIHLFHITSILLSSNKIRTTENFLSSGIINNKTITTFFRHLTTQIFRMNLAISRTQNRSIGTVMTIYLQYLNLSEPFCYRVRTL